MLTHGFLTAKHTNDGQVSEGSFGPVSEGSFGPESQPRGQKLERLQALVPAILCHEFIFHSLLCSAGFQEGLRNDDGESNK